MGASALSSAELTSTPPLKISFRMQSLFDYNSRNLIISAICLGVGVCCVLGFRYKNAKIKQVRFGEATDIPTLVVVEETILINEEQVREEIQLKPNETVSAEPSSTTADGDEPARSAHVSAEPAEVNLLGLRPGDAPIESSEKVEIEVSTQAITMVMEPTSLNEASNDAVNDVHEQKTEQTPLRNSPNGHAKADSAEQASTPNFTLADVPAVLCALDATTASLMTDGGRVSRARRPQSPGDAKHTTGRKREGGQTTPPRDASKPPIPALNSKDIAPQVNAGVNGVTNHATQAVLEASPPPSPPATQRIKRKPTKEASTDVVDNASVHSKSSDGQSKSKLKSKIGEIGDATRELFKKIGGGNEPNGMEMPEGFTLVTPPMPTQTLPQKPIVQPATAPPPAKTMPTTTPTPALPPAIHTLTNGSAVNATGISTHTPTTKKRRKGAKRTH